MITPVAWLAIDGSDRRRDLGGEFLGERSRTSLLLPRSLSFGARRVLRIRLHELTLGGVGIGVADDHVAHEHERPGVLVRDLAIDSDREVVSAATGDRRGLRHDIGGTGSVDLHECGANLQLRDTEAGRAGLVDIGDAIRSPLDGVGDTRGSLCRVTDGVRVGLGSRLVPDCRRVRGEVIREVLGGAGVV